MAIRRRGGEMFGRVLWRSLRQRRRRILVAVAGVLLGAMLVSALSSLSLDMGSKLSKELRAYGANVVLSPRNAVLAVGSGGMDFGGVEAESYLTEGDLSALDDASVSSHISGYAAYLYGVAQARGRAVMLAGAQLDKVREVSPWWAVTGEWVGSNDSRGAMVGANVARQLGLALGDELVVEYGGRQVALIVRGVVDTGASEDNQLFVNLGLAQETLGRPGAIGLVQVSASTGKRPLAETVGAVQKLLPHAQAKIIGQIAEAEANIFVKIQLLMGLVAVLVLIAAGLSVGSTMTTTVLERTREIGLLKALGATNRRIAALFLAETTAIGTAGGVAGFAGGSVIAEAIARNVFDSSLGIQWAAFPVTVGIALVVAVAGSLMPLRRAVGVDPVVTLRGD